MHSLIKYEQAIDSIVEKTKKEFKEDIVSILVIGSWAEGDFIPG